VHRALRFALVFLGALVAVAGLAWAVGFLPPDAGEALPRRDAFVGILTLGVLAFVAYGFDLRDWF